MTIPGTHWVHRTHGVGVDIYRTASVGGIDFDFNKPDPDEWRLKIFFEKQYNEGNLSFTAYRELYEDEELLDRVIKWRLTGDSTTPVVLSNPYLVLVGRVTTGRRRFPARCHSDREDNDGHST